MKELLEIIKVSRHARTPMALATIVQTAGSSYRRPGARMLISADGRTVGCISGGCLDQDVVRQGMEVIKNQKPVLITYDTQPDQDVIFGTGAGCRGVIEILVEFLPPKNSAKGTAPGFIDFLADVIHRRQTGAAATVIEATDGGELALGDRVTLSSLGDGVVKTTNSHSTEVLMRCARSALESLQSGITAYESQEGSARIFVETILPQTRLVIFGAGHDAMPLSRLANELGLAVTVADARSDYATRNRFPLAGEVITIHPDDGCPRQLFDPHTAVMIMTHNYFVDMAWLKCLLPLGLPYLGLMGPRKRAEKMLQELSLAGFEASEDELSSLHNPAGLDIGAETPEQIALAILAEIQAALTGREGGKLRQRKGAIHSATPATNLKMEEHPCSVLA